MRKQIVNCTLTSLLALWAGTAVQAQPSAYFSAVTNLNPRNYFPLNETTPTPGTAIAANSGSLGAADNGVFSQGAITGAKGALVGDPDTAAIFGVPGNAYMEAPYDPAYATVTTFTVEFWVNSPLQDPGTSATPDCIINCLDPASPRAGWLIYSDINGPGIFTFRTYNQNGTGFAINYNLPVPGGHILANTWYHVVVSYSQSTGIAQGYINGVPVAGQGISTSYVGSTAGPFTLGLRSDNSFQFYPGFLDEVAFYPTVLSASVVSNHYFTATNGVPGAYATLVSNSSPLLYYRLDDAEPLATNYGSAGASYDGIYQPTTTPGSSGPPYAGFGASSYAVTFPSGPATDNGATILVPSTTTPSSGATSNTPITVTAWALVPYTPTDFSTILGRGDKSFRFDVDTTGYPHWNAGNFGDITWDTVIADGYWHFWAGTYDGSNAMSLYIDGNLVAQSTGNTSNPLSTNVLELGAAPDYTGRNFDGGSLCHVAIFTNALTQGQIDTLFFSSGVTGIAPIITAQPQNTIVGPGSNMTLTVSVAGAAPFTYQWYSNNTAVGVSSSSFTVPAATTNADGIYFVTVTDSQSLTTMSSNAYVSVITPLAGGYYSAVTALGPYAYWPLNETNKPSTSTSTPETSEPIATNYGALGPMDNGYYLPGTYPGSVAGPSVPNFPGSGARNVAVAFNNTNWVAGNGNIGIAGFVDIPIDPNDNLNIQGPVTLAAWLQAKPSDGRFETAMGLGDDSYRLSVDGNSSDLLHYANGVSGQGDLDGVSPAGNINDSKWHFVVGTFDGVTEHLYVDGLLNSSQADAGQAIGSSLDFTIGEAPDDTGRVFDGNIAEVAIFNYALSPGQVQSLYYAAGIAPSITTEPPATITVPLGVTTTLSVAALGSPTLTYKWSTNNGASLLTGPEFSGTTTSTLTITSPSLQDSGTYVVVVSNAYGSITSTPTVFNATDFPVLTPLAASNYVLIGNSITLTVGEVGPTPITNAWYLNGVKLANGTNSSGTVISGATTTNLTISNAQVASDGNYTMYASNTFGTSSTTGALVVDLEPQLRDTGSYSLVQGVGSFTSQFKPVFSNGVVQMASDNPITSIDANAIWFNQKYYVGAFQVHFVFQDALNTVGGLCFVIQNSAKGTNACGDAGTALGVAEWSIVADAITNSFEFEIDEWNDQFGLDTNGIAAEFTSYSLPSPTTGSTNASPEFSLGDFGPTTNTYNGYSNPGTYDFWLTYFGTNLTIAYSNELTGITDEYVTNVGPEFIQSAVGGSNTAYFGFTAGTQILSEFPTGGGGFEYYTFTGGYGESMYISQFSYTPIISLSVAKTNNAVVLTWPGGVGGYMLQSTTNLATTNWTTLPMPYSTNASGMNQYIASPATGNVFYRLELP